MTRDAALRLALNLNAGSEAKLVAKAVPGLGVTVCYLATLQSPLERPSPNESLAELSLSTLALGIERRLGELLIRQNRPCKETQS